MFFSSWLRNRKASRPRRPVARYRPWLEALEDRTVPSQVSLTVTSLVDSGPGTLRAAILTADAGSHSDHFTIGFSVAGAIDLQSSLPDLNNSISIEGPGAGSLTVEQAPLTSFSSAIITVDADQSVSLSGLTIANGSQGGISNWGSLTVQNCTISGNTVPFVAGGGILNTGTLTVQNCTLSGNTADLAGGGISNAGKLTVSASTFSGNSALPGGWGGAIFDGGPLTIEGSTFRGNSAGYGGAIYVDTGETPVVRGSTFSGNSANDEGGGIFNTGVLLTVQGCTLTGNTTVFSFGQGGGIYNIGDLTIQQSTLSGNTAYSGGGIFTSAGTTTIQGSTLTGNTATCGGGIYNGGTATIQQSTLSGNTAGSDGGGIFNAASGTLAVKDSAVFNDLAPLGADIYNLGALTLDDSAVAVIGP
jgi:hypothetical protein